MKKNEIASIQVRGLKCDNSDGDYIDMSIPYEEYVSYVGIKCPKCGCVLLTAADFNLVKKSIKAITFLNKIASVLPRSDRKKEYTTYRGEMNGTGVIKFQKDDK